MKVRQPSFLNYKKLNKHKIINLKCLSTNKNKFSILYSQKINGAKLSVLISLVVKVNFCVDNFVLCHQTSAQVWEYSLLPLWAVFKSNGPKALLILSRSKKGLALVL